MHTYIYIYICIHTYIYYIYIILSCIHTYIYIYAYIHTYIIYILYTQPVVLYLFNSFHFSVTVFYLKYIIFSLGLLKVQPCLGILFYEN